jgi:hypothetical protein
VVDAREHQQLRLLMKVNKYPSHRTTISLHRVDPQGL